MADETFRTVLPPLKAVDNGDGTWSVAIVIGGNAIPLPVLTTVARDALTPAQGWLIYNSTTVQAEVYNGAAWVAIHSAALAAHALLDTGVHGAGGDILATDADITTHTADIDAHMVDFFQYMQVGSYYTNGRIRVGAAGLGADNLDAAPFFVARSVTFDRLAIDVAAGDAGKVARLGIYAMLDTGLPGALIVDGGEISVAGVAIVTSTINIQLTKGWWYLGYVSDGNPTIEYAKTSIDNPLGVLAADFAASRSGYRKTVFTYGALPDPFGAASLLDTGTGIAMVAARVSSLD